MDGHPSIPRLARRRLIEALEDDPVVLVHGPRQSGTSTLVRDVGDASGRTYVSFGDDALRASASADPVGFVRDLPARVTLDEVQRVPQLFTTLKAAVDRDRTPGRFLLTGSENVFAVPRFADSLAGRMSVLRLRPLAQSEREGAAPTFLDRLFTGSFAIGPIVRSGTPLQERIVAGGFPPASTRPTERRRARWYRDYVAAVTERDVRDLSRIAALDALPRLMELAAGQTARLINVSDFAALLGSGGDRLRSDHSTYGQLLETFVLQELRRHASGRDDDLRFFRYRDGNEVDIVERDGAEVTGVEVKGAATVTEGDVAGLKRLARAAGRDVPIQALWRGP